MSGLFDTPEHRDLLAVVATFVRLLAGTARPVPVETIAAELGRTVDEVNSTLANEPRVERDDQGRLSSLALGLTPTRTLVRLADKVFYAWCGPDAFGFPTLLNNAVRIEAVCPSTGTPVVVEATPDGIVSVNPLTAVVTFNLPATAEGSRDLRSTICDTSNLYASPEAASQWLGEHPRGMVLRAEAAHRFFETLFPAEPER